MNLGASMLGLAMRGALMRGLMLLGAAMRGLSTLGLAMRGVAEQGTYVHREANMVYPNRSYDMTTLYIQHMAMTPTHPAAHANGHVFSPHFTTTDRKPKS